MVLKAFWASLGLLVGALEGFLGGSWTPLGCFWGSLRSFSGAKRPSWAPLADLLKPSVAQIFFSDVFVLLFDPLGVDFELPR